MTLDTFSDFLSNAQPGEAITYHRGNLARMREHGFHPEARQINAIANNVWMAHKRGEVVLTQRRIGEAACEYIATRTGAA